MTPDALLPFDFNKSAILLDVDGTILDLAPTPREVWVPPELRRSLERLLKRTQGAVALVSGRSLHELDLIFTPLELAGIGCHGAELRSAAEQPIQDLSIKPLSDDIKRKFAVVKDLAPGILLEDKNFSLALHYRLAPQFEDAVLQEVSAIQDTLPSDAIEVLHGKWVLEIKPQGFTKASGVATLMKYPLFAGRKPIFIGDDITDESVFPIIPDYSGYCFSVGREVSGTNGQFDSPDSVRQWLARILEPSRDAALGRGA
jgi:trehalose 6-phosphate phosphatase